MDNLARTKVFYNSACPLCDAGITSQKGKMSACNVEWIDIHNDPDAVHELGADLEFVRERLHVKGEDGRVFVGASALVNLWARTPGQHLQARLAQSTILKPLCSCFYNLFAIALYRWNRWRRHW